MQTIRAKGFCTAFLLAFLVLFPLSADAASWLDEADVSWYEEGQNRFVISTEAQLAGLAKLVNDGNTFEDKTVRLGKDLNLEGKEWTPIGTGEKPFLGSFDGEGHLIRLNTSLFNVIGSIGEVKLGTVLGVHLSGDVVFSGDGGEDYEKVLGPLANRCLGTIRDSSFTGSVLVDFTKRRAIFLGGLVGEYDTGIEGVMSDCEVRARLEVRNAGRVKMAGIACHAFSDGEEPIRNCAFEGEFHLKRSSLYYYEEGKMGGIIAEGTGIKNCRARFSVFFSEIEAVKNAIDIGGIAGSAVSLENCLAEWTISEDCPVNIGGIVKGDHVSLVKNCVFSGDILVVGGKIGGIVGINYDDEGFVSNCFVRGRLSGGATIGGVAGVNAGEIKDCSVVCEVLPGAEATAGALVGDNQGTVSGCGWVSGLGPDNAVGDGEAPEGSGAVALESALPATSVVLTPFLRMLEGKTETVAAEVYPETSDKSAVSFSWTAEGTVLNIVSPNAEATEIKALKKGTADLKLSCGGLPGGEPLTPVISVLVRGLLPDPVSPDVPGPVSPDVPVVPLVPISADISWYDEMQTEFVVSTEEQIAGLAKLANGGKDFLGMTVRLDADLNLADKVWSPIYQFRGTFDGQGHTVRISAPLFDSISTKGSQVGTVLNLNLSGDIVFAFGEGEFQRGTLAKSCNGTLRNCSFTGSIIAECRGMGTVSLGGLYGTGAGEISDCRVRAQLEARGKYCDVKMGGITVGAAGGTIQNCSFEGNFRRGEMGKYAKQMTVGGIAAESSSSLKNCRARFAVTFAEPVTFSDALLGGIAGKCGTLENCLAEWTISEDCSGAGTASVGGIAGYYSGTEAAANCVFNGELDVGDGPRVFLGGIFGRIAESDSSGVYNCFARGSLSGGGTVGGVAGKATGTIENSSAACKIETGPNAVSGAIAGDNAGAVKECRWVSGLGAERAVGNGAEPVSTDVAASESALPATSIAVVPLLDLTENRDTPVKAEVYPQAAANKGAVGFSWTTADKDVLSIGSPNAETALVKGIKEGMAGLKLSCNGLLGGTTYNPTSSVTVRRVRLESLSLSPKGIELSQKGQRAEIHAAIRPAAEVASFPQCDWSFKVVEGASAEAEDIELTPAANGLGAAVTLVRPVSGAKYRVLAEAVDGSGLSDDIIVTVKYNSPAPTSPDVSPDIPAPLSPDVPAPVNPDIEVPEAPEKGVAPNLPDKAPAGVGSSKPEFFGGKESSALKSAAEALSDSGLTERDLTFDADTGVVRLQSRVVREVAGKVLPSGSTLRRVRTLPVLSAVLPQGANVAAVGLELTGTELLSKTASGVKLLKATGPDTGALLKWSGKPEEFGDGRFTVLDSGGGVVEELKPRGRYVLTVFIKDGGKYDLDGEVNGRVVDPLALLSVTGSSEPGPNPQPEPEGRDSGGGCDAGFLWGWLLLLAAVPVVGRRRG